MAKMKKPKSVDAYIESQERWSKELAKLRAAILATGLEEAVKWGMPVYTNNGRNVVGIAGFKNHFGIWFYEGVALADPDKVLTNAQEGKTQSMRHWKMASAKDIKVRSIKAYVKEAIEVSQQKKTVSKKKKPISVQIPAELDAALKKDKKAAKLFGDLSAAKQRDYAEYISTAKRVETKVKRLAKIMPMIREGAALQDMYRS